MNYAWQLPFSLLAIYFFYQVHFLSTRSFRMHLHMQ